MAGLQKRGELVLAAKCEYKLKHDTEENLELVPPTFWDYTFFVNLALLTGDTLTTSWGLILRL